MSLTNYPVFTYRDAIEHVVDVFAGQDAAYRTFRNARRAVDEAYRRLAARRNWHYYERIGHLTTEASQTTGTITYDHTGGTYERMITLSGATWPTDARYWSLLIGRLRYDVDDYKSSTVLTLTEAANPGADLASTAYTLYRDAYPLPDDFMSMGRMVDVLSGIQMLTQVTPDSALVLSRAVLTTQLPHLVTITGALHYPGGLQAVFSPSPTTVRNYDFVYRSKGKPLTVEKETTGTVTMSAGGTTVTGVGTNFTSAMEGGVLRLSSDTGQLPTGPFGNIEASEVDNTYAEQFIIKSVASTTSLTTETAAVNAYSATKFTISSRLDLETGAMLNYFLRLAEAHFARIEGREDRREREAAAEDAYLDAAGADKRSFADADGYKGPMRLRDLATSVNLS